LNPKALRDVWDAEEPELLSPTSSKLSFRLLVSSSLTSVIELCTHDHSCTTDNRKGKNKQEWSGNSKKKEREKNSEIKKNIVRQTLHLFALRNKRHKPK
jgi:hypothetical protein